MTAEKVCKHGNHVTLTPVTGYPLWPCTYEPRGSSLPTATASRTQRAATAEREIYSYTTMNHRLR